MKTLSRKFVWLFLLLLIPAASSFAQDATLSTLPKAYKLSGGKYYAQTWNNCGPATLTNTLSFFGYTNDQKRAAAWLKPNYEDKNVSPWQMVEFVNTQIPELPVYAIYRVGGTVDLLKTLIANNYPVIIEEGYDPPPHDLGWMGHYLLLTGYDDSVGVFISQDSYIGPNTNYTYDHIDEFWRNFNRTFIVIYQKDHESDVMALLGKDADAHQNAINALQQARNEAVANGNDVWAWFNMGSNFDSLGMYPEAATSYDQARKIGLPWRITWYQFGMYDAYIAVGRYQDVIDLAQATKNDGGGQYVEETFYYAGLAREGMGDKDRAILNFNTALEFNPNFTPARDALNKINSGG